MILFSNQCYKIWVGKDIHIPLILTFFMGMTALINMRNSIYLPLINGIGKIKLMLILSVITSIINIPLSILLIKKFNMGTEGVIISTFICIGFQSFFIFLQFQKLVKREAIGIWND